MRAPTAWRQRQRRTPPRLAPRCQSWTLDVLVALLLWHLQLLSLIAVAKSVLQQSRLAHRRLAGSSSCPKNPHQCVLLVQVIFASRTHSQLSQFVGELQRTPFALSLATVSLASRKVCNISCPALLRLTALCHTTVRLLPCPAQLNLKHTIVQSCKHTVEACQRLA